MNGKVFAQMAAVAAVAGFLGGAVSRGLPALAEAQPPAPAAKVVRAERVEIVDARGVPRAWLEVDADGNPGLFLAVEGCIVASMSLVGNGRPRLDFGDRCNVRAVFNVGSDGAPGLVFYDEAKKTVWKAP